MLKFGPKFRLLFVLAYILNFILELCVDKYIIKQLKGTMNYILVIFGAPQENNFQRNCDIFNWQVNQRQKRLKYLQFVFRIFDQMHEDVSDGLKLSIS